MKQVANPLSRAIATVSQKIRTNPTAGTPSPVGKQTAPTDTSVKPAVGASLAEATPVTAGNGGFGGPHMGGGAMGGMRMGGAPERLGSGPSPMRFGGGPAPERFGGAPAPVRFGGAPEHFGGAGPARPIGSAPGRPIGSAPGRPMGGEPGRPILGAPARPILGAPARPMGGEPGRPIGQPGFGGHPMGGGIGRPLGPRGGEPPMIGGFGRDHWQGGNMCNNAHDWCNHQWEGGWGPGCGFETRAGLWSLWNLDNALSWDYATCPIYGVSPISGWSCPEPLPAPDPSYTPQQAQDAMYVNLLGGMAAAQDPAAPDAKAGLWLNPQGFDPSNPDPSQKIAGPNAAAVAFNALQNGNKLYFHPPNGDWESINSVQDLNAYLYAQQSQQQAAAPAPVPPPVVVAPQPVHEGFWHRLFA